MYQHSLDYYWNQNNSQVPKQICVVGQFPLGMVEVGQQIKARQDITIYVVVFAIEKDVRIRSTTPFIRSKTAKDAAGMQESHCPQLLML